MVIDDDFYMSLAIQEAWNYQLLTYPNPAVGSVVVDNGQILSIQAHKEANTPHAEVLALKEAYLKKNPKSKLAQITDSFEIHKFLKENHNGYFSNCDIYVTLEPCNHIGRTPACSDLLVAIKPKRVIISVVDPNINASGGIKKLQDNSIQVDIGVCKSKGEDLLYPFFKYLEGKFIFFKLATRANGSIDGGYITSKESLEYVHKIRTKIDLLAIGGNTVRCDRPTLDCRFVDKSKSPNIMIYSRNNNFDKNIPLFNVKNRKVYISNKFDFNENFIMVEGGYNLLNLLYDKIDMLLLFISPNMKSLNNDEIRDMKYEILHSQRVGSDQLIFLQKKL
ncbi:bifunctional diaminohydroxyphosphoribosylaminopyrimidine deaminase/5-amino-6-(5-phosphoribosylamino)uracil reductase RibD [Arcobacter sp. FWKO B]|uniref:bifunctional diaminohydroxyphosphoribosylaminopyrimidine deaminase/5-amino-6-(5-phosphoribosylamino)uracil reductase RibD n=1 Tax=Arcobacter sp. FWKO B TaxID=2593672 RepID=UPI0018A4D8E4|nr:bifunctional diaminohydroxyphosphoribosylaminopyrimidine deaminase/5-amino-6-(5-phosphoribosylamino)uracil reductase RibD [Arcobacter sp. FWKO B]QOG12633.1 bifunctional diaminohydroxyphosphoribosylaminopyrimidine deaminase/5-amino-6-(5-phosphoribosylamino)uracil reductase RibD [Arcobacter sp. FWKO B]